MIRVLLHSSPLRRWRHLRLRRTSLLSHRRKILLARLKGDDFLTGGTFEIHREPERPNQKTRYAGRYILSRLKALFVGKLLKFDVVCGNFSRE